MRKRDFLFYIFLRYGGYIFLIILFVIFISYYGVYSFLGNEIVSRTGEKIILSKESSILNILFGVGSTIYTIYKMLERKF